MKRSGILAFMGLSALALAGCNSTGGVAADAQQALTGAQVQALFSGKTADWERMKNGNKTKVFTAADGEITVSYLNGKKAGEKRIAKWSVEDDMHCGIFGGKKKCGKIVPQGEGVYQKIGRNGRPCCTIRHFVEGKQL
jgi:predicted small secreted protein